MGAKETIIEKLAWNLNEPLDNNLTVYSSKRGILNMIFSRNFSVEIFLRTISRVLNHVKKIFLKNSLEKLTGHGRQKSIIDVKKIVPTI